MKNKLSVFNIKRIKKMFLPKYFYSFRLFYSGIALCLLFLVVSEKSVLLSEEINKENITVDYLYKKSNDDYILGEGDILLIEISKELPSFNGEYTIDPLGKINLPRLKRVFVQGLTITELEKLLNSRYTEYLIDPEIRISVLEHRSINIFIKGEVNKPGIYNLDGQYNPATFGAEKRNDKNENINLKSEKSNYYFPTLFSAIKKAGGITDYSKLDSIEIIRKNPLSEGGGKKVAKINLLNFIINNDETQNLRLRDDDIIVIKKAKQPLSSQIALAGRTNLNPDTVSVYVFGNVEFPGIVQLNKLSHLNDAIYASGGKKLFSGKITFIRKNGLNSFKRKFKHNTFAKEGSNLNPMLQDGDIIFIGKGKFRLANEIIKDITSPFVNIFQTYRLYQMFD